MSDPWYMFILLHHLGKDHIVWDKSAQIKFIKPGKGTVFASFVIDQSQIDNIRLQAQENYSVTPVFQVEIKNTTGDIVAVVIKELYVRRKDAKNSLELK